jgi:hypothetical protein
MPSKDFKVRIRDKNGKVFDNLVTSMVNFDSEDPAEARRKWEEMHAGTGQVLEDIQFVGDTSQETFKRILQMAPPGPVPDAVKNAQ